MNSMGLLFTRVTEGVLLAVYLIGVYFSLFGAQVTMTSICVDSVFLLAVCGLFLLPERYARFMHVKRRGTPTGQLIQRVTQYSGAIISLVVVWSFGFIAVSAYTLFVMCTRIIAYMMTLEWAASRACAERVTS